ncbi:hypothetical protein ES703_66207 [subsurface metagenome]
MIGRMDTTTFRLVMFSLAAVLFGTAIVVAVSRK